jgi:hypothetical protein
MRSKEDQEFVDYLKKRWEDLGNSKDYVNQKLHDDEMEWSELVNAGKKTSADASRALDHAEHVVSRTIRYVMLVAICTFLEEASREFVHRTFPSDCEERAKKKTGSLFAKYIKVLVDGGFDTTPVQEDIEKLSALITLRNCVVHAWGKISRADNPEAVRKAIVMVESAGTYEDGFLGFGDQVIPEAIIAAENIGNALIDQLLLKKTNNKLN